MSQDSFAALLASTREGRPEAFAQLYRSLQPGLLRYLRGGSGDRAEDVAAETWVEVVRRLDRFDGDEAGFRAWVFTIARSKAVDAGRKETRRRTVPLGRAEDADLLVTEGDATADPVQEHFGTERALALIRSLPPDQAEAVTLRVVVGMEVGEVATVMGRTPGSVRVLTHRGLKKLAASLAIRTEEEVGT